MGLWALTVDAFGDPDTLAKPERRMRRRRWWLTGGPVSFVRGWVLEFDRRAVADWHSWARDLPVLDTLSWPAGFDPAGMRARIDCYLLGWAVLTARWAAIERWVGRAAQLVAVAGGWLVLLRIADRVQSGWTAVGIAALGVLLGYGAFRLIYFRFVPAQTWRWLLAKGILASLGLAAAAASTRLIHDGRGWSAVATALLAAPLAMVALYVLVVGPVRVIGLLRVSLFRRWWPRERILDHLVQILGETAVVGKRNDLGSRTLWMWLLEQSASTLERRLPAMLHTYDRMTRAWTNERARGAAAALRRLKRQILAPEPGSWDRVASVLRQDVIALVTGELRQLRWASPPSPVEMRRSRWRSVLIGLRTLVIMAVPLIGVLAVAPLLHLDPPVLGWAKVAGLTWAALYLLLTIDPTLREKIETIRSLTNTDRDAGRPTANG